MSRDEISFVCCGIDNSDVSTGIGGSVVANGDGGGDVIAAAAAAADTTNA